MDLPCAVHDNAAFKLRVDDDPRSRGGRQAEKDRLQQEGVIPAGVKFQISLPTPIAPTHNNMVPTDRPALIPVLTTHMLGEVTAIAQALPNDRIALQWDVCQEVIAWPGARHIDRRTPLRACSVVVSDQKRTHRTFSGDFSSYRACVLLTVMSGGNG
jgi:hypothetical protein